MHRLSPRPDESGPTAKLATASSWRYDPSMSAAALVDLLKRRLKAHGITYAQLATRLRLSEASVKRMFSRESFTLQRLEEVCRVVRIDFAELARALSDELAGTSHLTVEQERQIASDPKLLLVALCA